MIERSLVRFAIVGLANTAFGYSAILLLHYGLGAGAVVANFGGYAVGAMLSYVLHRNFTFTSDRRHVEAMPRFILAAVGCFTLNLVVLDLSVSVLALSMPLAQALAVASYTAAFYLTSRFLVFRA